MVSCEHPFASRGCRTLLSRTGSITQNCAAHTTDRGCEIERPATRRVGQIRSNALPKLSLLWICRRRTRCSPLAGKVKRSGNCSGAGILPSRTMPGPWRAVFRGADAGLRGDCAADRPGRATERRGGIATRTRAVGGRRTRLPTWPACHRLSDSPAGGHTRLPSTPLSTMIR